MEDFSFSRHSTVLEKMKELNELLSEQCVASLSLFDRFPVLRQTCPDLLDGLRNVLDEKVTVEAEILALERGKRPSASLCALAALWGSLRGFWAGE